MKESSYVQDFWDIIEQAKTASGSEKELSQYLEDALCGLDGESILRWDLIYRRYQDLAHKEKIWGAADIMMGGYSSADVFEYFRGWLIVQGKEIYHAALENPDSLSLLGYHEDPTYEAGNYVAANAYAKGIGRDYYKVSRGAKLEQKTERDMLSGIRYADDIDNAQASYDKSEYPGLCKTYVFGRDNPYIPPDGAAIRYTDVSLLDYSRVTEFKRSGHICREDIAADAYARRSFEEDAQLDSITVTMSHRTYGDGSSLRDATPRELELARSGLLFDAHSEMKTHTIHREELTNLVDRPESTFFYAVKGIAQLAGFTMRGVDSSGLVFDLDNENTLTVKEDGRVIAEDSLSADHQEEADRLRRIVASLLDIAGITITPCEDREFQPDNEQEELTGLGMSQ